MGGGKIRGTPGGSRIDWEKGGGGLGRKKQAAGVVLMVFGGGMLVMFFLPGWGILVALGLLTAGFFLLRGEDCEE